MDSSYLISAQNLKKTFPQGAGELSILKGVDFKLKTGEAVAILGASGAGKSTLLQILGTLDRPQSGELHFLGKDLFQMKEEDLALFRNKEIGFVFQFHHLISELTALENVMLPSQIGGEIKSFARHKAEGLLSKLGLSDRLHHYPNELSGGELQRVSIARALVCRPRVLMADEPTGNLDSVNSKIIQDLFFELKESFNLSLIVVTHDLQFAARFPRVLRLKDGHWE
ncbi:MAG TPA: ABC transporter ATP-binding protein [Pseudobdellovibrionaceae bacterium]|nr:ABC transporter ATP-binding protein [Pseudobdellovibrionaceae bacterium]